MHEYQTPRLRRDAVRIQAGPRRELINFDRVYCEYIEPALREAGLEVSRGKKIRACDIRLDMFQELLMADLVVADVTINNASV